MMPSRRPSGLRLPMGAYSFETRASLAQRVRGSVRLGS